MWKLNTPIFSTRFICEFIFLMILKERYKKDFWNRIVEHLIKWFFWQTILKDYNNNLIWEGDMGFWRPAEKPEVMIVGPTRSGGTTIMTEGRSKGCQNPYRPSQIMLLLLLLLPATFLGFRSKVF